MNTFQNLLPEDAAYPSGLRSGTLDRVAPAIAAVGDLDILRAPALALFCSVKCPGKLILQTYDLAVALRGAGRTVASGFHSPMEKECLALLLRGAQPVIICPARSIEGMRLPAEWKAALSDGRLLILSPFPPSQRRASAETVRIRNKLVAAVSDDVFVAYAAPGGKTEQFCRELTGSGKLLLTLDEPDNSHLIALGATPVRPGEVQTRWS